MAKRRQPRLENITRRDFLGGVATAGIAAALSPLAAPLARAQALADPRGAWTYPPAKTGMRGSHAGSFEVAHAVAWEGKAFERPEVLTDSPYDLVIVGGGISGLASAVLARQKLGQGARILILDNHDDFGGHAKRNEFTVNGKTLVGYGGSQSIDGPGGYSAGSRDFIRLLGIDTDKFYRYFDQSFYARNGMGRGLSVAKEGVEKPYFFTRTGQASGYGLWAAYTDEEKAELATMIRGLPLPAEDRAAMHRWFVEQPDWLSGKPEAEKFAYLKATSYEACMREHGGFSDAALALLRGEPEGLWGLGWDALSGLEAVRLWQGGTLGLGLDPATVPHPYEGDEPYIFHFPDGNAGVARLAVARLIPDAVEARSMDEEVLARVHYDRLDRASNTVRIRLSSTVVDTRNTPEGVEVTYVRGDKAARVEARYAIMAGYSHMLPHIMPELPAAQVEAINWPEKVPLVYTNVALTNWRAFKAAGVSQVSTPGGFFNNYSLDFPVSMGGYRFAANPDEPIMLHMVKVPTAPGLTSREQHQAGRYALYSTPFEAFEEAIVSELTRTLGPFGFDAQADIAGITVNRWPHGYAYEYNELFEPDFSRDHGPHIAARARVGRIAIAGSDASAYAYVNGAVDAAIRAVDELFG
jgi:spermidine dehydrogenase